MDNDTDQSDGRHTKVIDARQRQRGISPAEIWAFRELLILFVKRQIASRYRQMLLGGVWAFLEPLALLLMMTVVFGMLLRVDSAGYPYPVYAFAGLIPWFLFSKATLAVAGSLQENMQLISKVYFPRVILPIAALCREYFDSLITVIILVVLAAAYGFLPTWKYLVIVPGMALVALAALGIGLWFAALMVKFRDVRPLLAILLQAGMYGTPILYSPALVPPSVLPFYQLNPMYWGVEAFRWIMLGQDFVVTPSFYISMGGVAFVFVTGLFIFHAFEKETVDVQ